MLKIQKIVLIISLFLVSLLCVVCSPQPENPLEKLIIGLVAYDEGANSIEKYRNFQEYLGQKTHSFVELEPTFNELNALSRIESKNWSIVFAPSGIAAIAISKYEYKAIFPLQGKQGLNNLRSVLVARKDSFIKKIADLSNKIVGLGEPGSAIGYYLPLYDLYGLTLKEIRFAPNPKTILEWLNKKEIDAGALSEEDFQSDRRDFSTEFRVIHKTRFIPPGVVLLSPNLNSKQQEEIITAMKIAPPNLIIDTGYIANGEVSDYKQLIEIIDKVKPLEKKLGEKPVFLN